MGTGLVFKKTAKMLLLHGYRVVAWEDDNYTGKERKGDFVSLDFGKEGCSKIGGLNWDETWNVFRYGFNYIPGRHNGCGCEVFKSNTITMGEIERLMNTSYPNFVKNVQSYSSVSEFIRKELAFYRFKHEVTLKELKDIEIEEEQK